jgi:membrane associated rhomboid family serine protease
VNRWAKDGVDPVTGVREVIFPKRGLSATELLLAINLAVAAALFLAWGRNYEVNLRHWVDGWWNAVHSDRAYGWWLPTIFLHVGPGHLARNMVALLVAS